MPYDPHGGPNEGCSEFDPGPEVQQCTGYANDHERCDREDTRECQICKEPRCEDHAFERPSMNAYICGGMRHW